MFKLFVVCAIVATAVAEPDPALLLSTPLVQPYAAYSTVVSPASTSISSQSSSVIHPSPISYTAPLAFSHFIKKRSAQILAVPTLNPFPLLPFSSIPSAKLTAELSAQSPILQPPTVYAGAELSLGGHLIKKRSAQVLTTPYITPTYINHEAITPFLTNPLISNYYPIPSIPLATTHFIKKRSAEPAPEPSADPQLLTFPGYPATTYYAGSPLIPHYPTTTLIKSVPVISTHPFVYSTLIKK